jgi:hypothetical protein
VRCQRLMPVILANQEAEIRRIVVWSQPGKRTYLEKTHHQKGWWSGSRGKNPYLASMRPEFKHEAWVQAEVPQKRKKKKKREMKRRNELSDMYLPCMLCAWSSCLVPSLGQTHMVGIINIPIFFLDTES